jgi:hypothetical protein
LLRKKPKFQAEFIILSKSFKSHPADPVKIELLLAEGYYFSSARNYANLVNDLEVILLDLFANLLAHS